MKSARAGAARTIVAAAILMALPQPAQALDWAVNTLDDLDDGTCDGTHCSLREALASLGSNDTVSFDFTSTGQTTFTIAINSGLLIDAGEVIIDGLDCTGCGTVASNTNSVSAGFNSALAVRIEPSGTYSGGPLLTIEGNDVGVIGLNLDGGPGSAVVVDGEGTILEDLWIGTSISGGAGIGNTGNGIETLVAPDLEILDCLISGNAANGISISDPASDRPIIQGSIIGLDVTGTTPDGNSGHGIYILGNGADIVRPTIGGTSASEGNLVSGNTGDGIHLKDKILGENLTATQSYGVIANNIVGTNGAVTVALPNGGSGLRLQASPGGGNEPEELWVVDNVFSGNGGAGIWLEGTKEIVIHNNAVGTDIAGTAQLGNAGAGIYLAGALVAGGHDTKDHEIGAIGAGNIVAYNEGVGVHVHRRQTSGSGEKVKENPIRGNSIYGNGGTGGALGIDLESDSSGPGPTTPAANACTNDDTMGNRGIGRPEITSADYAAGTLTVVGTSCSNAVVDVYLADGDPSGYGEPMTYLGSVTASGTAWTLTTAATGLANNDPITALQTDSELETSESALNVALLSCDDDGDGVDSTIVDCGGTDCDDTDPTTYPGATELCDGVDNGCNGSVPANEADGDGDGEMICAGDCDDTSAAINTSATEVCDGVDTDCDTVIPADETDDDGDGDNECGDGDCDDTDLTIFVGATETCDGVDEDCDTVVDNGFDGDGDTVTSCGPDGIASNADDDCDDTNSSIFPGATDTPDDGIDQDCSGTDTITCFVDNDGDGWGSASTLLAPDGDCTGTGEATGTGDCDDNDGAVFPGQTEACNGIDDSCAGSLGASEIDADSDGEMACAGDCDDTAAAINTSATEVCDAIDNDCDTTVDEGFDADGDGVTTCGPDGIANNTDDDCDDTASGIFPGATDTPDDGIDQDCSGADTVTCYVDGDGDGVGDGVLLAADGDCTDTGEAAVDGDCDDAVATIFPGATETCDGVDQDCDTDIDEDFDGDGDGYAAGTGCPAPVDCDDTNAAINPGALEICDTIDNNCDGQIDEEADGDGDGFTNCQGDCDDGNATVFPGATEACDGLDTDCDTTLPADEADADSDGEMACAGDCDDADASINTTAAEVCDGVDQDCDSLVDEGFDADGDGVTTCGADGVSGNADDDCDDGDAAVLPGGTETCDGVDEDCDGSIDEDFDGDGDGFVAGAGCPGVLDCDDTNAAVNPDATEACDGIDNNCDGQIDEEADNDGDGFTNCTGDCDDTNAAINPSASETCDGVDEDCDGALPADEADADNDGEMECDGDCDDADAAVNTSAAEVCDTVDNDCDGTVDEGLDLDGDGFLPCVDDCDDDDADVHPDADELCDGIDQDCDGDLDEDFDVDGDGVTSCGDDGTDGTEDDDCDDDDDTVHPGATEVCDGVDNDCDGDIDEVVDEDGDGVTGCDGDCDDNDDTVYPGADELCDGLDNDCDELVPDVETDDDGDGDSECGDGDCDDEDATVFVGAEEVCEDDIDQDCDGADTLCEDVVPGDVDVTLGEVPGCQDCASVSPGGGGGAWLLLVLIGALRRRRTA